MSKIFSLRQLAYSILKNRSILEVLGIFFFVLTITSFYARFDVDPFHDGLMLKPALDVSYGKILFRETFTNYGALTTFIHAGSLVILGKSLFTIRFTAAVFYAITGAFLWLLWRTFLSKRQTLLAIVLWILLAPYYTQTFYPWPSVYATCFVVINLYLFTFLLKKKGKGVFVKVNPSILFLLGFFSALALLAKQTYTIVIFVYPVLFSFFVMLKIINKRSLLTSCIYFFAGCFTVLCLFLIWAISFHAFHDFLLQTIRIGYINGKILGVSYNFRDHFFPPDVWAIFPLVCIFFVLGYGRHLLFKSHSYEHILLFSLSFLSLASVIQYFPASDHSHTYWAATPTFGAVVYYFAILIQWGRKRNTSFSQYQMVYLFLLFIANAAGIFFLLQAGIAGVKNAAAKARKDVVTISEPSILRGMRVSRTDAVFYRDVFFSISTYLSNHPEKQFVSNDVNPIYMTFTPRAKNITTMYFNFSNVTSGIYPYEPELYKFIAAQKPLVLLPSYLTQSIKDYKVIKEWKEKKISLLAPESYYKNQ